MKMLRNRRRGFIPAIMVVFLLIAGLPGPAAHAQDYNNNGNYNNSDGYNNNGDYQEFYDDLAPYGQWMNDPQYGYVWAPNTGRDFRPYYTNGHWVMTEYGNMWVSDYSWGWAPFHYGRWAQSSYYGWIWIPGNVWGPAWVNWRQGGGYYGWSPMGPGISINISFGSGYSVPYDWWTFIPCNHIYAPSYAPYYVPRRTVNIINNTTIINNTYVDNRSRNTYVTGPRRTEIERTTRQRVAVYNVNNRTRSGATAINGRNVDVYRPKIATVSAVRGQGRPAPSQVKNLDRSVITNTGGGRAPARPANQAIRNGNNQTIQPRDAQRVQQTGRTEQVQQQRLQRDQQIQQRNQQQTQRDQQLQQQRVQQERQNVQRDQQIQQQRAQQEQQRIQRDQQIQQQRAQQDQQRIQRDQQMQQQRAQQEQQRIQRDQQMQQQRMQQDQQRVQRDQQAQQRAQQQQMQRSQQVQQQRSVERAQPQPRSVERSAPAPQQQRSVERSSRGR